MEKAHNMLYYKTNWLDPQVFTEQEVREYYRENLTEDGYISFLDMEDDRVRGADEGDQEEEGAGGGDTSPVLPVNAEVALDEQGQPLAPPQPLQQPPQPPAIVQVTWAEWCASLVRRTYGEAAITVTKEHSSQHHMVKLMSAFIKDLAKEVERVGGLSAQEEGDCEAQC
jgi:hypothetical protein